MLTDKQLTALGLLESEGYPRPTATILAGWTCIDSLSQARRLLRELRNMGFCTRDYKGRHEITEEGRMARDGTLFAE